MAYVKKKKAQDPSYKLKRKKSNRKNVGTTQLHFYPAVMASGSVSYIDLGQCLSKVNRRLYRQGMCYYVHSIVAQLPNTTGSSTLTIETIPDTWVANNAWVKSYALWEEMNAQVLKDSPSIKGTWHDYKVFFDSDHVAGGTASTGPNLNLGPVSMDATSFLNGDWVMSEFVLPEHDVDPATGQPLSADEFTVHMLGADVGSTSAGANLSSGGIIDMFQNTRARIQESPVVPADLSTSWGTLLTDLGASEPELSDILESANDIPPYNRFSYQGGSANVPEGTYQCMLKTVPTNYDIVSTFNGFITPLGLMKLTFTHSESETSRFRLWVNLVPGKYHGVHAEPMGQ